MKRKFLILTLATAVAAGTASFAIAGNTSVGVMSGAEASSLPKQQHGNRFKYNREKKHAAMAELLGLTGTQRARIKDIITAARRNNASLRHKLAADRKKVTELSNTIPFDETAVRSLIASDETVRTDLVVSRLKVRNQIHAVLTPEQQTKAKELRLLTLDTRRGWGRPGF